MLSAGNPVSSYGEGEADHGPLPSESELDAITDRDRFRTRAAELGIRVAIEAVYELKLGVKRVHVETGAEWRFAPGIQARHPAPAPDESRDTTNQ